MFPELSEKAWEEICHPSWADAVDGANNFMSLFDLEKYPITCDTVFKYLKSNKDYAAILTPEGLNTVDCFTFRHRRTITFVTRNGSESVSYLLNRISYTSEKDRIIIIGEIHGWWVKGKSE